MKLWNDALRICPKCRKTLEFREEEEKPCPRCGTRVWFFNYRTVTPPPPLPEFERTSTWESPQTKALLAISAAGALTALLAVKSGIISSAASALVCLGFGVFGVIRHREALGYEDRLQHADAVLRYGKVQEERIQDLSRRYAALLRTGDQRIEHYYEEIYGAAEKEREAARRDRNAVMTVERRIFAMAERLVDDHRKWSTQKMRSDPENYMKRKNELQKAFDFVESVGYALPPEIRTQAQNRLKEDYKRKVHEDQQKEQQREFNRQAREEQKLIREQQAAIAEAERVEQELEVRLTAALAQQQDVHSEEVRELQRQLAEAQAERERAKSQAQLTKKGHVYILSNIGSFGEGVFKVGMTRRLDPNDRVLELGDASVPFPFDVHAMIACDDAPKLEHVLHHHLTRFRVNRVNLRKEFFQVDLETILAAVRMNFGDIEYVAEPEALEYRETQSITPEQLMRVEQELEDMGIHFEEAEDEV